MSNGWDMDGIWIGYGLDMDWVCHGYVMDMRYVMDMNEYVINK
jgi:hypothetical protein